jgi:hypothetical protein
MNPEQAKEILSLYRPDTADANDPAFAEALALSGNDAELKQWFDAHCESYKALRARFREIPIPPGLKEQIVAERKVHTEKFQPRRVAIGVAVSLALLLLVYGGINLQESRARTSLPAFREWTVSNSLRLYRMNLETNDLGQIRKYLAENGFESNFTLPAPLQKDARPTGCTLLQWNGKHVTMVCFRSGKQLAPGETSDLFLFVADQSAVRKSKDAVSVTKVDPATTASWTSDGRIYLLVAAGDENFLRKYL